MARKPRDFDAELKALMAKTKQVKSQKTVQLGELVQVTGADTLPIEALAGALLAAVEQAKTQPEAVAGWAERGQAFFQQGSRRRTKSGSGTGTGNGEGADEPAAGAAGHGAATQAPDPGA